MSDATAGLFTTSWAGTGDTHRKKYGTVVNAEFMKFFSARVGILPFTKPMDIPENAGRTMIARRFVTDTVIAPTIAEGANAALTDRFISTVQMELTEYGKAHPISKIVAKTGIGDVKREMRRNMASETARDIEDLLYQVISPLAQGSLPRLDTLAGNHQFFVTTSAGAADGTTIVSTDLNQANDYWNTGSVCPLQGKNAGCAARLVDDFVGASGTVSVTAANAFEWQVASGTRCVIARNVGHTLNDPDQIISSDAFSKVRVEMVKNSALPFDGVGLDEYLNVSSAENPMRGRFFAGLTPEQYADMFKDARFRAVAEQGDGWKDRWANYSLTRWLNFAIFELPRQFKTDNPAAAGSAEAQTFQANGAVHVATFLAQDAVATTKIKGYGEGKAAVIIRDKVPGPNTTDQPTDGYGVMSVNFWYGRTVIGGPWGWNYATSALN